MQARFSYRELIFIKLSVLLPIVLFFDIFLLSAERDQTNHIYLNSLVFLDAESSIPRYVALNNGSVAHQDLAGPGLLVASRHRSLQVLL